MLCGLEETGLGLNHFIGAKKVEESGFRQRQNLWHKLLVSN